MKHKRIECKKIAALCLAIMLFILPLQTVGGRASAASDGMLRVLLTRIGTSRTSLTFVTTCAYAVNKTGGERIPSGSTVKIGVSGGEMYLRAGGETYALGSSFTLLRLAKGGSGVRFTSPTVSGVYCGDMLFTLNGGGIRPVLRAYIEDYLYGVVGYEMSNSFPLEALKAQAVCARTYAMRLKKSGGYYDVTDNTSNQVFKGYDASYKNVIAAVNATKGVCLTYGGSYAGCWYTASNGGQTESTKNAWGGTLAYSVIQDDPYDLANPSSVKKTHTVYKTPDSQHALHAKLETLLKNGLGSQLQALGLSGEPGDIRIERVKSITPHSPRYDEPSRTFTRLRFGLRASSENASGERTQAPETLYVDLKTYDQLASILNLEIGSTTAETVSVEETEDAFSIVFRRYGHGVGLSQRGAQQMAKANGMTYQQILSFYFPGTAMTTFSFADSTAQDSNAPEVDEPQEYETLCYGDNGEDVKALQAKLKALGYFTGEIGGNYLALTTAAVKAFQADNGFEPDGIATGEMQKKLFSQELGATTTAAPTPTPSPTNAPTAQPSPTPSPEPESDLRVGGYAKVSIPEGSRLVARSKPATVAARIGLLSSGTLVRIYGLQGGWAAFSGGGLKGYVTSKYLTYTESPGAQSPTPTPAPTPVPTPTPEPTQSPSPDEQETAWNVYAKVRIPTGSKLILRAQAAATSAKLTYLTNGAKLKVYARAGEWARVSNGTRTGYVLTKYLRIFG